MAYLPKAYKIIEIKNMTKEVKLIRVKCNINPMPGQFFQVSIPGIGECPLASCSFDSKYVDVLVRNAGTVTNEIFKLKKSELLYIRGPYGKGFPVKRFKEKNIILIGGGCGIAPVTSLIDYVEKNRRSFKNVQIYLGFRDEKNLLLSDKITKWERKYNVCVSVDKVTEKWRGEMGFLNDVMDKKKPISENVIACLCGPEIMMNMITQKLNSFGIDDSKIYWSMERRMECGIGNCGRCLIQDVYVCRDGPVFRYDKIKTKIENEESANKIEVGK